MQQRPFISYSIDDIEDAYARAAGEGDRTTLALIAHELGFRKTPRGRELRDMVADVLAGEAQSRQTPASRTASVSPQLSIPLPLRPPEATPSRSATRPKQSKAGNGKRKAALQHPPTPEQLQAIAHFGQGGSLRINAYAGAGKTSTLEMLAHATSRRGQYLAFNRDIVADARTKFPSTVACNTTHSLAMRSVAARYAGDAKKLTSRVNANQLAEVLGLKYWRIDKDHALQPRSQGFLILETVRRFCMSADAEPLPQHVPQQGNLITASDETLRAVNEFAVRGAKHVWARMQEARDAIPLGHDGYLKLWALSNPVIAADFILMDEAQDTNPVVLNVLRNQPAQMIYVGDKYQQIYEWRGAVNAMEAIDTTHQTFLTTSFRFGSGIAEPATKILGMLGESKPLRGNPAMSSRIARTPAARAVLARTNAYAITAVIDALDAGQRPHLIGGTDELIRMLEGVADLKNGVASTVPDFFGFGNWQEVVQFARSAEGEHLQTFVNLVESRGERQLMWALRRTADAEDCDLIVSTAHKAKGREWPTVRLMDDFIKSQPKRGQHESDGMEEPRLDPSELRLLYVALTRAKLSIEVPDPLLKLMTLQRSQTGTVSAAQATPPGGPPTQPITRVAPPRPGTAPMQAPPLAPKPAWSPPQNWTPEAAPQPPPARPSRHDATPPAEMRPKRKGFLRWLLGS